MWLMRRCCSQLGLQRRRAVGLRAPPQTRGAKSQRRRPLDESTLQRRHEELRLLRKQFVERYAAVVDVEGAPPRANSRVQVPEKSKFAAQPTFTDEISSVLDLLADHKCDDVALYHVRSRMHVYDLVVLATGLSTRHVHFVAQEVAELAESGGFGVGNNGRAKVATVDDGWKSVKCKDILVQILLPDARETLDFETVFACERVPEDMWSNPMAFEPEYPEMPLKEWGHLIQTGEDEEEP